MGRSRSLPCLGKMRDILNSGQMRNSCWFSFPEELIICVFNIYIFCKPLSPFIHHFPFFFLFVCIEMWFQNSHTCKWYLGVHAYRCISELLRAHAYLNSYMECAILDSHMQWMVYPHRALHFIPLFILPSLILFFYLICLIFSFSYCTWAKILHGA